MRTHVKLLLAAATAIVALSAAVGAASARRIELSERQFRQIWTGLEFKSEGGTVFARCAVTLEGSFHSRTLSKVCGQLVGYISRVAVGTCATGRATALTETLPWHIRYQSFGGTLPNITELTQQLVGAAWRITNIFTCLTSTTAANPARGITRVVNGQVTSLEPDPNTLIPNTNCGFAPRGRFTGNSEVFAGASGTARITIRLVQ